MRGVILIISILVSAQVFSKSVLITYFDPFGGKKDNNSKTIANLVQSLNLNGNLHIETCELPTVFDESFETLYDCLNSMKKRADFVISLGEAGCSKLKIETRGINFDKNITEDNLGHVRSGVEIISGEEKYLGVTLPVDRAYCSLNKSQKKSVFISNSAGSFVCNNTLFHGLVKLEVPYTFIHVPQTSCSTTHSNIKNSEIIFKMIEKFSEIEIEDTYLAANKNKVKAAISSSPDECQQTFYRILLGEY